MCRTIAGEHVGDSYMSTWPLESPRIRSVETRY